MSLEPFGAPYKCPPSLGSRLWMLKIMKKAVLLLLGLFISMSIWVSSNAPQLDSNDHHLTILHLAPKETPGILNPMQVSP